MADWFILLSILWFIAKSFCHNEYIENNSGYSELQWRHNIICYNTTGDYCDNGFLTNSYNGSSEALFSGELSAACVKNYYNHFMVKDEPSRDYKYFHEVFKPDTKLVPKANKELFYPTSRTYDSSDFGFRIIGGSGIRIDQAPYQVLYGIYCGGSIIAPYWVLTSAHCKDKETFVLAGNTLRSKGISYPICGHFIHPEWYSENKMHSHDYDYQLIFLERPIPITPETRPIAIGSISDIQIGAMVAISGWGHTHYKGKMVDDLHQVYVPIVDSLVCSHLSQSYNNITERMFCGGYLNGGSDSCQGDSGGPVVINGKLVGLVSYGVGCAEAVKPGVYTNVPYIRHWLRSITGLPL